MLRIIILNVFFILLGIASSRACHGQDFSLSLWGDAGSGQLSDGAYLKPALQAGYCPGNFMFAAGIQWTFPGEDRKALSGLQAVACREFLVGKIPFSANLFALLNPYSELVREFNIGLMLEHRRDHLTVQLGNSTRVYGLTRDAATDRSMTGVDGSMSMVEYRNFVYRFTAYLNEQNSRWNAGIGLSNNDHFRVQQEANPMFMVTGLAELPSELTFETEFWLQRTGMTNLAAQHYGMYLRIGVTWRPGSGK